jgi:hypothetical protein
MSDNYEDILSQSWDNIPVPKALPVGSYLLKAGSASFQPAKDADKSPSVLFVHSPKEAMDDVDREALEGLGENYDIAGNRLFTRIFIETAADWDKVRNLVKKHGVDVAGKSIQDTLKAVRGREIIGYVDQNTYEDKTTGELRTGNNTKGFVAVE